MIDKKEISKRQKIARRVFYALFAIFMIGVLAFTIYKDFGTGKKILSFKEILEVVGKNYHYLLFALISLIAYIFLEVLKIFMMLYVSTKRAMFKVATSTVMMGKYYDNITPLGVGGQPFQAYKLTQNGVDGGTATAIPISSLFLSQIAFFIVSLVAIIIDKNGLLGSQSIATGYTEVLFYIGIVLIMIVPFLVILFFILPRQVMGMVTFVVKILSKLKLVKNPEVMKYKVIVAVKKYYRAIKLMARSKGCLLVGFITSLLIPIASGSITYFTLRTFGYDILNLSGIMEWGQIVCAHLILTCSVSFIPTPGNAGVSEITFYSLFTANLLGGIGITAMLTWRFFIYYFFIIYGLITLTKGIFKKKKALI
ncbi:MAG: flippase-like domain-containing protein [Clostridiales bacterium]|nr:flippase-like domain-containing protein [Clostridiales bacterium]